MKEGGFEGGFFAEKLSAGLSRSIFTADSKITARLPQDCRKIAARTRVPWVANHVKPTPFITGRQVDNFIQATVHAENYGMPLNVAATIHWAVAGGPGGGDWRERRRRLFINARHWFGRRHAPWAAVWTVEAGTLGKDVHTHLAFHLPAHISLADVEAYFRKALGDVEERVLVMNPVGPPLYLPGWRHYMLKGMDPGLWKAYGVPSRFRQSQGIVTGQRCGVSRTIGAAARSRRIAGGLHDQAAA